MRPKLLLLDNPCATATGIFEEVFDTSSRWELPDAIYTGLTPVETFVPVFCPCTGIDHVKAKEVIYLDYAWKLGEGIKVTSTAEHTWSLLLRLAKKKHMQLSGKTIGIIGYGRIGKQVAKYARAFNMCVGYSDIGDDWKDGLCAYDIVTLHIPLNESTKGIIGEKELDMMKDGALLINTSRPEIVDEKALIDWLQTPRAGNYYADDFENDRLIFCPNAIQTPHIAGDCLEARELTDIYIAKKACEWWKERSMNP